MSHGHFNGMENDYHNRLYHYHEANHDHEDKAGADDSADDSSYHCRKYTNLDEVPNGLSHGLGDHNVYRNFYVFDRVSGNNYPRSHSDSNQDHDRLRNFDINDCHYGSRGFLHHGHGGGYGHRHAHLRGHRVSVANWHPQASFPDIGSYLWLQAGLRLQSTYAGWL